MRVDLQKWMQDNMLESGMSQSDIARKSGLSTAVVAQIATGKTKNPTIGNVVKIARAMGVTLDSVNYYVIELDY